MKLICLTTQQDNNFITNKHHNLHAQLLTKSSTYKIINSKPHKLINLQDHKLTNSSTYKLKNSNKHQLTNPSTHQLARPQIYTLINLQTQKLKNINSQTYKFAQLNSYFLFYKTTQNFDSFQRKYWLKRRQIYTISNLSRLLHCLFLSIEPAFCTILPFQLLANL